MKMYSLAFFTLLFSLVIAGCGKSKDTPDDPDIPGSQEVYVVGYDGPDNAVLWKNGKEEKIAGRSSGSCDVYSVYVTGDDVYIAGMEILGNSSVATLWKNGVAQSLSDGSGGCAYAVYVSGSDVYAAGYFSTTNISEATLWKNGVREWNDKTSSHAYAVYASGSDIYMSGYSSNRDGAGHYEEYPVFWKNGQREVLESKFFNNVRMNQVNSVFVSGNDVYTAGYLNSDGNGKYIAVLWKNGIEQPLTDGIFPSKAESVYVSGNDVYVAGSGQEYGTGAVLWKNGIAQPLEEGTSAKAVFVKGNDVYVVGSGNKGQTAVMWKNGKIQTLTDGSKAAIARAVFVN